ncbi:MAG: ribulose-phosphate 3-epimerase [candidate division Zixibacteria bacterium RBG_16_48_11]|nr:MAG: ribulose-phosphate 3-epimerase [candidate division Zixibacteria bacterium RBG_16_48_11]
MVKVAASILAGDFRNLEKEIKAVEKAGADWIHLDVMDGHFVNNLTFGPVIVEAVNEITNLPLDVHLMISNPDKYIERYAQAGADYLTVHVETCPEVKKTFQVIKNSGCKAGLALKPATPLETVLPYLEQIDLLLVMSVNPGFAGQAFMPEVLPKLKKAREYIDKKNLKVELEVDGGINPHTAAEVRKNGATALVAASAIFGQKDYAEVIRKLRGVD